MSSSTALSDCKEVNVWQEGCSSVDGAGDKCDPHNGEQRFVALQDQMLFILTAFEYAPLTKSLAVHRNGLLVDPLKVTELSPTTFFLQAENIQAGDIVVANALTGVTAEVDVLITDLSVTEVVLTDGQQTVPFPVDTPVQDSSVYINGFGVDNGRLVEGVNYTVNAAANTVNLVESFPAGTILLLTYNDTADPTPPIVLPVNTLWYEVATTISTSSHATLIVGATILVNYFNSALTPDSGVSWRYTGVTDLLKAGDILIGDGFIYDIDGKQFGVDAPEFSIRYYGAVGDGDGFGNGTDDSAAISTTLEHVIAIGGGVIDIPFAIYRMDGNMVPTPAGIKLTLNVNNSIIDHTNGTSRGFSFEGIRSAASTLTNDVAQFATSFDTPLAASLVKGDLVQLVQDDFPTPAAALTLSTLSANSAVTVTADAPVFVAGDVGKMIPQTAGQGVLFITGFTSSTEVNGYNGATAFSTTLLVSGAWRLGTQATWTQANLYFHEFHKVDEISGNTITPMSPFLDPYAPASEVQVYKITPMQLTINDLNIIADVDANGVLIEFGENCSFNNVHTLGFRGAGLTVLHSYNTNINFCSAVLAWLSPGIGLNYGLSIAGSQNTYTDNCTFTTGREGITHGSSQKVHTSLITNTVIGSSLGVHWGFDTHSNVSNVSVIGCTLTEGFIINGWNTRISECVIYMGADSLDKMCRIVMPTGTGDYIKVTDNEFRSGTPSTMLSALDIDASFKDSVLKLLDVSRNKITMPDSGGIFIPPPANYDSGSKIEVAKFLENVIETGDACLTLFPSSGRSLLIDEVEISGDMKSTSPAGLILRITPENAARFFINKVNIHDLNLLSTVATTDNVNISTTNYIRVNNCFFDGDKLSRRALFSPLISGNISNNTFKGYTDFGGLVAGGNLNVVVSNNDHTESAGTPSMTAQFPISNISGNGLRTVDGDHAPTGGISGNNWTLGEKINNTVPVAAGTMGWVCVESGTFSSNTDLGDTDGATAVITNMAGHFFTLNSYVDCSAGFPTTGPFLVIAVTSDTITIDTDSDAVLNGIVVDTSDPIFNTFGDIAA